MLGFARIALAADADLLGMLIRFLSRMGAEIVAAVCSAKAPGLAHLPIRQVVVGDLEDLEMLARAAGAQLLIGNSHALEGARRLGLPLLRAGFPQYDLVGGHARSWVGYRGTRQTLFDLANLILGQHHELQAYRSIYRTAARDSKAPGQPDVPSPATGLVPQG